MSDLLMESKLPDEHLDFVETIKVSSENLLGVINNILDYSKIESGNIEVEMHPFKLNTIIEEVIEMLSPKAKEKNIKLIFHPEMNLYILSDQVKIKQILINLVNNAIKFTPKGEVVIKVSSENYLGNQKKIFFSIIDTGIGIPQEKADRLFKSFSQIDSSTTRKYGGTGLGLAISKKLVELLEGEIWIESEVDKGSTFHFTLIAESLLQKLSPLDKVEPIDLNHTLSQELKAIPQIKILIAEDNLINQKVTLKILEKLGLSADIASNGLQVIEKLKEEAYDLILMDIQMPEMDGLETTQIIREEMFSLIKIPIIIAMTANAFKEDKERSLEAGMNDYLSKPIQKSILEAMIRKWFVPEYNE